MLGAVAASALAVTGIVATAAGSDAVAARSRHRSAAPVPRTAIPGSYIVVLNGQRSQAETRATNASLATSVRRQGARPVRRRAQRLLGEEDGKEAARRTRRSPTSSRTRRSPTRRTTRRGAWTGSTSATCRWTRSTRTRAPATASPRTSSTPASVTRTRTSAAARGGYDAVDDGRTATTATATARTSPAPWAARTYGVAKDVKLVAVRVLDCSGSGTTAASSPASTG